jgi:hypothetical protein
VQRVLNTRAAQDYRPQQVRGAWELVPSALLQLCEGREGLVR